MRFLVVALLVAMTIWKTDASSKCDIPENHSDNEIEYEDPKQPWAGERCLKIGLFQVIVKRCLSQYCCGEPCYCDSPDALKHYPNCSSSSPVVELRCYKEKSYRSVYGYICCPGYVEINKTCVDIDECGQSTTNGCQYKETCKNTAGGYTCGCPPDKQLSLDGRTCIDKQDECNTTAGKNCSGGSCLHTPDGSRCTCSPTHSLDSSGVTCHDKCSEAKYCQYRCLNVGNTFRCLCESGYFLDVDGKSCLDINECETNNGGCSHNCTNNNGSFVCTCPSHMSLSSDRKTCRVTNPCMIANGGCSDTCTKTTDSFVCSCPKGTSLSDDKKTCVGAAGAVAQEGVPVVAYAAPAAAAGLLLLLLPCCLFFFCCRRRKKQDEEEEEDSDIGTSAFSNAIYDQRDLPVQPKGGAVGGLASTKKQPLDVVYVMEEKPNAKKEEANRRPSDSEMIHPRRQSTRQLIQDDDAGYDNIPANHFSMPPTGIHSKKTSEKSSTAKDRSVSMNPGMGQPPSYLTAVKGVRSPPTFKGIPESDEGAYSNDCFDDSEGASYSNDVKKEKLEPPTVVYPDVKKTKK